nr:sulfotransferase [Oleiphilus sp. HI0125]
MCSERSGSNFITKLMNGHKNICGPSVKHIINPVARNLFRYGDLTQEENWRTLVRDIFELFQVKFSIWKYSPTVDEMLALAPRGDVVSLLRNLFMAEAKEHGKQSVFIKENHTYEFLPFLLFNFPESKFVYLVRDPRDMALSWKKNSDHLGGVVQAARQWKQDQQQNLKNASLMKGLGKAHFVRYEDLTANTEIELHQICDFLGMQYDPGMLEFHKDKLTQENSKMQKAWNNLSTGIIEDNSNKYLKELSKQELMAIESICRYEMKHTGYEPVSSERELDSVTDADVAVLHKQELDALDYSRTEGVKGNMVAKAKFYQR